MRIQGAYLPAAGLAVLTLAVATLVRSLEPAPLNAQGRASAIQSAGGGAGPLAAPDAKDPANAKADLVAAAAGPCADGRTNRSSSSGCRPAIASSPSSRIR